MHTKTAFGFATLIAVALFAVALSPTLALEDDYGTGVAQGGIYCPALSTTMQRGSSDAKTGGQVTELQLFLADYYDLNEADIVTGFFGKLTDKYVKQFQTEQGLPAKGIVGSLTRARIAELCGGNDPFPGVTLSVTPWPGKTNEFQAQISVGQWTYYTYEIDWGEGDDSQQSVTSRVVTVCRAWDGGCAAPAGVVHRYSSPGYFTINLYAIKTTDTGENIRSLVRSAAARVSEVPQSNGITVAAPNGGEQWEIGQLNTITWSPYGYNPNVNPAQDVDVYLVRKCTPTDGSVQCEKTGFVDIGRIMDTGKASLHTYFNLENYNNWAPPGQFNVRVVNRVTGATDISDAPFTLLPRGVDIKVDGSDGPVTLVDNQRVTVSISTGADFASCILNGIRANPGANPSISLGQAGAGGSSFSEGYAYAPTPGSSTAIYITCTKADGSTRGDAVQVNIGGSSASLRVTSPNGGEQIPINQTYAIRWNQNGLRSASVALYKNDQWLTWIQKDVVNTFGGETSIPWVPLDDNLSGPLVGGTIYKIYITGQKADGTGYIDDKSDAPFGFVSNTPGLAPTCTLKSDKTSIKSGERVRLTWTSGNALYAVWSGGDKANPNGSAEFRNITKTTTLSLRFVGSDGQTTTCSTTISVGGGKSADAEALSNLASVLVAIQATLDAVSKSLGL